MLFNSFEFLIFFPIVTAIYFALPKKAQWIWLLVMSYFFYMNWHAEYALLMAACTIVTHACSLIITDLKEKKHKKIAMWGGIVFNIGLLAYFKYTGFLLDVIQRVCDLVGLPVTTPKVSILLPVGISFYIFQALSYMIDVYKGRVKAERNLFKYALFVSFFPQLVAGPIERSSRLLKQVTAEHRFDWERTRQGLLIMMLGFFEKVVIADRACMYVDAIYGGWIDASGAQIALATVVFAVQDLCDFAGYSHIAIGAAKILGIELMTNFRQPYFAHSVQNFWARWHISLSTWFRDYIYFPLGAGRGGKLKAARNLMIVYTVSGLWHGAALKYVAWGMLNGALQVIEGWMPQPKNKPKYPKLDLLAHILWTDFLILITMLVFRAGSLSSALGMLWRIPTAWGSAGIDSGFGAMQALCTGICFVILFAIELIHEKRKTLTAITDRLPVFARGALYLLGVLAIIVFGVWGPGYTAQAFIYFQF
ncbi:MAG: MBOAT family protein [Clostridia bacterium]|nr:MBOAT family protein [Clostridia bacterium]